MRLFQFKDFEAVIMTVAASFKEARIVIKHKL